VGIAAERFGGQLNDTMSIENYISRYSRPTAPNSPLTSKPKCSTTT
jgi:alkyl hydroperoxide reductase subunit AhpF